MIRELFPEAENDEIDTFIKLFRLSEIGVFKDERLEF
jgi:hypothetical protein